MADSDDSARWRVFISHTSELRDFPRGTSYIAAVERAISAAGHVIVDMADFPAADQAPAQLCIERVRGCDVYVGVLGTRYGSPVLDMPQVSYTELEFDTATQAHLDRLLFLLDTDAEDVGIPPSALVDRDFGTRKEAFHRRVRDSGLVTRSFGNPVALGQLVERSLRDLADKRRRRSQAQLNVSPPVSAAPDVQISLPTDAAAFTGRDEELDTITAALTGAAKAGSVVVIAAIDGMPGVGKTALAVHAAYLLRENFPDLPPLFIDLHGYTPGQEPVRPEDALARLLSDTGVDPRHLPDNLDERARMWRARMAGRRALLVLDNAASSSQIIPLLPGGGDCLVLVTSRPYLGDLPGTVTPLLLEALPPQQAKEMFIRLAPRAGDSRGEVADIVQQAGYLPLAISMLARVFNRHPSWTLANLANETRAKALTLRAEYANVAAAFEISYQSLDPGLQRLFRLLGLHPGSTADDYAAAALAATSPAEAADLLDCLHREGLVTEIGYRRYGMHDLLRRYASDLAAREGADSQEALGRLLDYYDHTAARAEARLACQPEPVPHPAGQAAAPPLEDIGQALAWVGADRLNLLACLDYVTRTGQNARVMALTAALATDFQREGPWPDAITRHEAAIQAARRLGDRPGMASALNHLGIARRLIGYYSDAAQAHEQALDICRDLGDRPGEARTLSSLGTVRRQTGKYADAIRIYKQAMWIYHDLGESIGEAHALHYLGIAWWQIGEYQNAMQDLEKAIEIYRDLGDRLSVPHALNHLGIAWRLTGDYPGAARVHEEALGICQDLKDRLAEADVCVDFGIVRRMTGDYAGATEYLEQASRLFRDLGDRRGEANAVNNLGIVWRLTGDPHGAIRAHDEALTVFRKLGDRRGEAFALTYLGAARRVVSEYLTAFQAIEQALDIYHDIGNQGGEAEALNEIGTLYRIRGDPIEAEASHQQALELARTVVSPWSEAHALAGLGRCALARGHIAEAENLLRQAHALLQRIGAADADAILAELNDLAGSGQGNTG